MEEQLTNLLKDHLSIRFIVIDTLQRVRPCNGEQYNYGADYEVMCSLKQIADRFGITILAVHHTRKQKSDDAFERISGTTGLMGSADGALVLQKHSRVAQEAVLDVTGRDVPDLRLRLLFDREESIWRFIGYEGEEPTEYRDLLLEAISAFVKEVQSWEGTATELLEQLDIDSNIRVKPNVLTRRLKANAQVLRDTYGIQHSGSTRTASSRRIHLSQIK